MKSNTARRLTWALCIAILVFAFVLRFKPAYYAAQLEPVPDALEYALSSLSLYERGAFEITINGRDFPPRYPFGFPLLLTPAFALFGAAPHSALYISLLFSMAIVALVMLAARRLFGGMAACVAGWVVAVSRAHVTNGQQIMSDSAGAVLALLACLLVARWAAGERQWRSLLLAGLLSGLAVAINYAHVAGLAGLLLALAVFERRRPRLMLRSVLTLSLGALPWGLALLAYQWTVFGSPLKTGYGFWSITEYADVTRSFSLNHLTVAPGGGAGNLEFYARLFLGINDSFYPPLFVLAIGLGIVSLLRADGRQRRLLLVLALVACASMGLYSLYAYRYRRFALLAASVLAMCGAGGAQQLWRWTAARRGWQALAGQGVFVLLCAGLFWAGLQPARSSFLLRAWLRPGGWQEYPTRYEAARYLNGRLPADALLVSGIPGPILDYYVLKDSDRTALAITRQGSEYAASTPGGEWPVADEQPEIITAAISQGRPVYLMDDPDTRGQDGRALDFLRSRFVFSERGALAPPARPTITLYQLEPRER